MQVSNMRDIASALYHSGRREAVVHNIQYWLKGLEEIDLAPNQVELGSMIK